MSEMAKAKSASAAEPLLRDLDEAAFFADARPIFTAALAQVLEGDDAVVDTVTGTIVFEDTFV